MCDYALRVVDDVRASLPLHYMCDVSEGMHLYVACSFSDDVVIVDKQIAFVWGQLSNKVSVDFLKTKTKTIIIVMKLTRGRKTTFSIIFGNIVPVLI